MLFVADAIDIIVVVAGVVIAATPVVAAPFGAALAAATALVDATIVALVRH